jgi:hypothetical protein
MIINQAAVGFGKMNAGYTCGLSFRHARDGRGDGRSETTGPA